MKTVPGGIIAPLMFRCAGVACGVKTAAGAPDLALIVSDLPAAAAGVFTTNRVQAAPVVLSRKRVAGGKMRGIVANSGNANACTGARGMRDAARMAQLAAEFTATRSEEFLVAGTGIIGRPLPMGRIQKGIRAAAADLGRTPRHAEAVAHAIMTTDTVPKSAAVQLTLHGRSVRIGGIAKGSGMIAPNMATMLAFLTSDCAIRAPLLRSLLRDVVERTFNAVTVDGDCSTNDTVFLLANAAAENPTLTRSGKAAEIFRGGLLAVCQKLAESIARDGEGATRLITVRVTGARSRGEAKSVARKIAESPLVKTAVHGGDPNWGRIICAAGYSGAPVQPEKMRLKINGVQLFRNGAPCRVRPDRLAACMKPKEVAIHLDLGCGRQEATMWTCDLSKEYITINAEYHT